MVGTWEVIPRPDFKRSDATSDIAAKRVAELLDLYDVQAVASDQWGCVMRRVSGKVGQRVAWRDLEPLQLALTAAILDTHGTPQEREGNYNVGHMLWTSDNALVYGHTIAPHGRVSARYGGLAQTVELGLTLGTDWSRTSKGRFWAALSGHPFAAT